MHKEIINSENENFLKLRQNMHKFFDFKLETWEYRTKFLID